MNANFANIEENRKNKILSGILKLLSIPFKTEKNMLFTVLLCIVAYTVGVVLHNDIVMEYVDLFAKVIAIISFVGVYEFLFELRKRNAKEERILNMQARNLDMLVRVTKRIEGDSNKILKELSSHLKMDVRKDSKLVDLIVRIEKIIGESMEKEKSDFERFIEKELMHSERIDKMIIGEKSSEKEFSAL